MGGRLLRTWLLRAAARRSSASRIGSTPSRTSRFAPPSAASCASRCKTVHDMERLVARAALGTAGPRDLGRAAPVARRCCRACGCSSASCRRRSSRSLARRARRPCRLARQQLESSLVDEPPALARDGGVDSRRRRRRARRAPRHQPLGQAAHRRDGRSRARPDRHHSLKIRYNRVFGYYIEISKSNLGSVPADYHRKQTIAGGERFITPALKEYEDKVLGADERIVEREIELFEALRRRVAEEAPRVQDTARGARRARRARGAGRDRRPRTTTPSR